MNKKVVILGAVAAGSKVAAKVKRDKPNYEVVIYTKDENVSYSACGMPYYIGNLINNIDDLIVRTVEEFEENGTLPNENYEKCDSDYFAFKCSFDAYGLKYYAYAFKSGTTREKEMLSLNYLPDICGTELEKKLKAALDEIASTYSETKAN